MKVWTATVTEPKPRDRRKSHFKTIYTVHARTKGAVEKRLSRLLRDGRTIQKIVEDKRDVLNIEVRYAEDP